MSDGMGVAAGVISAVAIGSAVLLYGTYSHSSTAQLVGGIIALSAIGLLAAYIHNLPSLGHEEY
jgi:hypothetical protein